MRLRDVDGKVVVIPESGTEVLAGPFDSSPAARLWILETLEAGLSETKRAEWGKVAAAMPQPTRDLGIELHLIEMVIHGKSFEEIARYIPKPERRQVDRRMLAAHDVP